jgi:subtilisin-like proprotein convertase family protein
VGAGECDDLPRTHCAELATLADGVVFGVCAGGSYGAPGLPADIPDLAYVASSITVPDDFVISRVMVKIEILHPYCADLRVVLTAPSGDQIRLAQGRGDETDDCYAETFFDDDAAVGLGDATAPFTGAFQPDEALAGLVGLDSQGTWTLTVEDCVGNDVGELVAWRLTLW